MAEIVARESAFETTVGGPNLVHSRTSYSSAGRLAWFELKRNSLSSGMSVVTDNWDHYLAPLPTQ